MKRFLFGGLAAVMIVILCVLVAKGVEFRTESEYVAEGSADLHSEVTVTLQNTVLVSKVLGFVTVRDLGAPFTLVMLDSLPANSCVTTLKIERLEIVTNTGKKQVIENRELPISSGSHITRNGAANDVKSALFQEADLKFDGARGVMVRGIIVLAGCASPTRLSLQREFSLAKKKRVGWES